MWWEVVIVGAAWAGAIVAAYGVGRVHGARHQRRVSELEAPRLDCLCGHPLSSHDKANKWCHDTVVRACQWDWDGKPVAQERADCPCMCYVGFGIAETIGDEADNVDA